MPRGGHNRKPTVLKVIQGTTRRDRMPANEPKPAPIAPKCPSWLDREAKAEWRRLAPKLEKLGLLTEADGSAFAVYCEAYSRWKRAALALRKLDVTDPAFRKVAVTLEKAAQELRAQGARFGLSPADRGRLDVPAQDEDEDDDFFTVRPRRMGP